MSIGIHSATCLVEDHCQSNSAEEASEAGKQEQLSRNFYRSDHSILIIVIMNALTLEKFQSVDANPGATLQKFHDYTEQIKLLFQLTFRKSDGTAFEPSDSDKKAMLLFKGGKDMKNLFNHIGRVLDTDTYEQAIAKIIKGLQDRTNDVVQRNMLLSNYPQGTKSFEKWSQEISNAAQLINYDNYNWKKAAVDAMVLQTSNPRLRERALQDNVSYDTLINLGISKEQSVLGAAKLEKASGQSSQQSQSQIKVEEEVRKLRLENKQLKSKAKGSCTRCGNKSCNGKKCPANGKECGKCGKQNHFAKVCFSKKKTSVGQISSAEESDSEDESSGRVVVGNVGSSNICAKVLAKGLLDGAKSQQINLAPDTWISKTVLNRIDWMKVRGMQVRKNLKTLPSIWHALSLAYQRKGAS